MLYDASILHFTRDVVKNRVRECAFADASIGIPFDGVKDIFKILGSHVWMQQFLNLEGEQDKSSVLFRIFFNRFYVHGVRDRDFLRVVSVFSILDSAPRGTCVF